MVIEGAIKLRDGAAVQGIACQRRRARSRAAAAARSAAVMTLSELSIRRPVFATVLSLLLLIVGVMAALRLSIREYPDVSQPVVSINVNYRGANAAVIETRVTQVIENEVAGLEGVDKLTSQSRDESASVNVQFNADRDVDDAANDVRDRVSRVMARLPQEADAPQIQKTDSGSDPVLFVIISSNKRNALELTDYAERYLVDRISSRARRRQRVPQRRSPLCHAHLAGSRRAGGAPDRGHRHRERAAQRERRAAGRAHRIASSASSRCAPTPRCAPRRISATWWSGAAPDGYLVRLGEVATVQLAAENQRSGAATNDGPAHHDAGGGAVHGQRAGSGSGHQEGNGADPRGPARGHQRRSEHRQLGVHPGVDEEGAAGAVRDAGHRAGGDLPVPGQRARDADSGGHHPGIDLRGRHGDGWRWAIPSTR